MCYDESNERLCVREAMQVGLTINKNESLLPVTEEQLRHSVYEILSVLAILSDSAHGHGEADTSCGVIDFINEPEQVRLLENSLIWKYIVPMYQFAELGEPLDVVEYHLSDMLGDLSKWITATDPILAYDGTPSDQSVVKIIYKFLARLKLNYHWDLQGKDSSEHRTDLFDHSGIVNYGLDPLSSGFFIETHARHLTLVELTLLAGMGNIRSVRNAQFSKTDSLAFIKEGVQVLITVEDARRWLKGRKGFVPTKGIQY